MNAAILTISSLGLIIGVANLAVMAKTANELKKAKAEVDHLKAKVNHNATVVKAALNSMEL